jgi:uncharacterized protein (TIGR04255 family)
VIVPPHNFSKSPVKEVICRYYTSGNSPVEILITKPYPGWEVIRNEMADSLNRYQNETFHDLMLTYTDEFHLFPDDEPVHLISIAPDIPKSLAKLMLYGLKMEIILPGAEKGTLIQIRYTWKTDMIILDFQAMSQNEKVYARDATLNWFEKAREDIHLVFDVIVSETLRKRCL